MEAVIARAIDLVIVFRERPINLKSEIIIPKESDKIGYKIGAISILPIMTATLSIISPKVAVRMDKTTIKKNLDLVCYPQLRGQLPGPCRSL